MSTSPRPIVVHKYGGSSLATLEKIQAVARRVAATVEAGHRVVAVVSAMGGMTDELLGRAKALSAAPNARELDMLLSVGERISTALLAIALDELGHPAVSFTGSQSGIITNTRHNRARILEVRPYRLMDALDQGRVVVVAGYQGVSYGREITTLGRGGTDTTAVALAAALGAEHCEILSDVDGVYTADPRVVPDARRLDEIDAGAMVALARQGARVLNQDCVEYASRHGVALFAKATFGPRDDSGTVVRVNPASEPPALTAIAHRHEVVGLRLEPDVDVAAAIDALAADGVHATSIEGGGQDLATTVSVALDDAHRLDHALSRLAQRLGDGAVEAHRGHGTVTLVGHGLGDEPSLVSRAVALAQGQAGRAVGVRLGPLSLTLTVPSAAVDAVVRALHGEWLGAGSA